MEMVIHLDEDIFEIVEKGIKDVEARVNDEKRRKLKVGDKIVFLKRPLEVDKMSATVIGLEYYDNFSELVNHYEMKRLYLDNYSKEDYLNLMKRFYTDEEQKEFGVVAILFRKD